MPYIDIKRTGKYRKSDYYWVRDMDCISRPCFEPSKRIGAWSAILGGHPHKHRIKICATHFDAGEVCPTEDKFSTRIHPQLRDAREAKGWIARRV